LPKKKAPQPIQLEAELISIMSDPKRPDSLVSILEEVQQVGSRVRDRLSSDMIRLLGQLVDAAETEEYMLFTEYSAVLSGTLELLRRFDLHAVHSPGKSGPAQYNSKGRARLKRSLKTLEKFLPSWSNNLSNTYFNHARTLPINIGDDL